MSNTHSYAPTPSCLQHECCLLMFSLHLHVCKGGAEVLNPEAAPFHGIITHMFVRPEMQIALKHVSLHAQDTDYHLPVLNVQTKGIGICHERRHALSRHGCCMCILCSHLHAHFRGASMLLQAGQPDDMED